MKSARHMAELIRNASAPSAALRAGAAACIDTLIDVIETQRGPAVVPPAPDLQPLRELRQWHAIARDTTGKTPHAEAVRILNQYFPKGDQL